MPTLDEQEDDNGGDTEAWEDELPGPNNEDEDD